MKHKKLRKLKQEMENEIALREHELRNVYKEGTKSFSNVLASRDTTKVWLGVINHWLSDAF